MSQLQDYPAPAFNVERAQLSWRAGPCCITGPCPDKGVERQTAVEDDNWYALIDYLNNVNCPDDWEVVQFAHWACEYVLGVFVRPGSEAETICDEFADFLGA